MKIRTLLSGLLIMAAASCQDPIEVSPSLDVTPATLDAQADGETLTFSVTANMAWTATAEGLTINPASGEGSDKATTVSVTVPVNTVEEAKTYTITVSVDDTELSKTVTVNQAAAEPEPEYELDGKQWKTEMDGLEALLDFGVLEEGFLTIAIPTMDNSGFGLTMVGTYEIEKTDNKSGTVTFELYDWEYDEFYDTVEISYSDLGETSVKFSCEGLFGDDEMHEAELVENPYDIEFDNGEEGPEGEIPDGEYWFIVPGLNKVMTPLAEDETSGFLAAEDAVDGTSTAANAFTITYKVDDYFNYYLIQDSYGRYLYQSMEEDGSFSRKISVSETLPGSNDEDLMYYMWTVYNNEDGTYDLYNEVSYYSISYNETNDCFEVYDIYEDDFENLFAALVPVE